MKDNQQVKPVLDVAAGVVTFEFRGLAPLTLTMAKLHPDILARAAMAGMAQVRLVDAAAVGREGPDGRIRTPEEMVALKRDAIARLIEHYESGSPEWGVRGPASGGGGTHSLTLRAVAAVQGVAVETMAERVAELAERKGTTTRALLAQLAKAKDVAAKMVEMRGPGRADAAGLMDELMAN